ncbi:TIGR03067 domain-containing protein [Gemmata sp. G18]|uniref:TIGR03067 domain-containing protein n=1 Tax=Gemmata palustris TaxID=2822762 RepID=A0ABS5C1R1_9BACT|nr:TIGR03067 domain-containing protein [Gemmata palustris]MBP3959390.1 TIGR03067 domain-containing protein [Gemmata palustris]
MRVLALTALTIALAFAPVRAADDATEKELKRFQGDWQMVEVTKDGETRKGDKLKDRVWSFKGDKLVPLYNKDDAATIKIDPSKKPATLDILDKNGDRVEGIYKFTGDDTLTICGRGDSKRPTEFAAKKESGAILFVLERVKK